MLVVSSMLFGALRSRLLPLHAVGTVAVMVALGGVGGCSSSSGSTDAVETCDVQVDAFKELIVVEPSVIDDSRAKNEPAGGWSFRHAVESMTPAGVSPSAFVRGWLHTWVDTSAFNGQALDHEPRNAEMNNLILCPWLRRTVSNNCDLTCSKCTSQELDLGKAPFRLLAIMNRMDLRTQLDASSPAGEMRLVFGLTAGPADDPASQPRAFTTIFEYAYPSSKSVKEWAEAWHSLGAHAAYDEVYRGELESLTESVVGPNKSPERPNGSAIAQVRTNESALNWIWQLREFRLSGGSLQISSTKNTPLETLNNTPILASWVTKNAAAIKDNKYVVPESLLGGSANQFLFRWALPNVDEETRRAFAAGTCSGCHSGDISARESAFHVSPFVSGTAKLSPFVWDPGAKVQGKDEVSKRTVLYKQTLCSP